MTDKDKRKDLAIAFLEISEADWDALIKEGVAQHLVHLIPSVVALQDDVEEAKKFFIDLKEMSLLPKIDTHLEAIDKIRVGLSAVVFDEVLDNKEKNEILDEVLQVVTKAYTKYAKLESDTVRTMREKSNKIPVEAGFLEKVRPYWNYIDSFWPSVRESVLSKWSEYLEEETSALNEGTSSLKVAEMLSPHHVLIKVESLLRKRNMPLSAQRIADAADKIKNYYVEEIGLIPAYMGAQGNWKVEKDDCPDLRLPEKVTKVTDRFAFCRVGDKNCPSFRWSQGSYVKCASYVTLKEAAKIKDIQKLSSKEHLAQIEELAESDPFVRMLLVESNRRKGDLYYGVKVDDTIETLLDQYPSSKRRGKFQYKIYLVANEPILISGNYVIAADKALLETIGEGERMPKNASTVKTAGPVMRVTFTGNALRDPEFRDFLRKKNAVKTKHLTYDIPFDREEDVSFFLEEVKGEFGYKVEVFQIMEDADQFIEKDFGIYRYTDFPISKYSAFRVALTYIPASPSKVERVPSVMSLEGSQKLADVVSNLATDDPLRSRVAALSDRLRVSAHIFIASKKDIIRYANGAIGVVPEVGQQWMEKDPDTGETTMVELVEVVRQANKSPAYKVRRIDNGKEIEIKKAWLRSACPPEMGPSMPPVPHDHMPPPPEFMGMPPVPEGPPPFAHVIGEDDVYYIVQVPKSVSAPPPPEAFEPPPFGRFPGDVTLKVPPAVNPPGGGHLPFLPPVAPVSSPPPGGAPVSGPATQDSGSVFVVNDRPMLNPDAPKEEESTEDFVEKEIVDDIRQKARPGLKFMNLPRDPSAPSGAAEEEVDEAVIKLRNMFKGDPRVKDVRRDLSPHGKPILYLHTTMPRAMKKEVPSSINGFEVVVSPLHDSLLREMEESDVESAAEHGEVAEDITADSLVNPLPNRPENGKERGNGYPPGPYPDQVGGPPPMNDQLVTQVRDLPKGR